MIITDLCQVPEILPKVIVLKDHLGGFDDNFSNEIISVVNQRAKEQNKIQKVLYHQPLEKIITNQYDNCQFEIDSAMQRWFHTGHFKQYNTHPDINFKNFICSFNGSPHVSRKLLVAIMNQFGWFDSKYSSKNFSFLRDTIDGHISDFVKDRDAFWSKFFIGKNADQFFQTVYSFDYVRFFHSKNIYTLENKLTQSFLHIVSETMATSRYPYITEKSFYSIVTRGLFLAYAQPNWHNHLEKYYGFKKYKNLFDYRFDEIVNPVERLVELMTMISKFSTLSVTDWHDLYLLEQDTIEYNYNHYFSQDYLKCLAKYS